MITGFESEYISLIKSVRDQAVPLVDALGVPDEKLNSSLGRYDGSVYEDYVKRAMNDPMNSSGFGEATRKKFYD
ncbi:Peroxisomal acyl-coenzyme A oxidase 1, partial [Smittium culicis]